MWWMVVLMSTGLIGLGVGLLVRDIFWPLAQDAKPNEAGEPAPTAGSRKSLFARMGLAAGDTTGKVIEGSQRHTPRAAGGSAKSAQRGEDVPVVRLSALEQHWPRLRTEIEAAVGSVNQSMAPLSLAIGAPGQATWSLHNTGFGDYRRVTIDGESVGWLRLEIGKDLAIAMRLRSHEAEHSSVNRDCTVPARRNAGQLEQALTENLAGVFEYAVERHSNKIRTPAAVLPVTPSAPPTPPPITSLRSQPSAAAVLVDDAVALVNRAFAEAQAQLVAADGRHGPATGPDDRALSITARGVSVGLMLVEPRDDHIDISVGVADLANFEAARRQSQAMAGLTVQVLAEAIATTAWPAIAAAAQRVASA